MNPICIGYQAVKSALPCTAERGKYRPLGWRGSLMLSGFIATISGFAIALIQSLYLLSGVFFLGAAAVGVGLVLARKNQDLESKLSQCETLEERTKRLDKEISSLKNTKSGLKKTIPKLEKQSQELGAHIRQVKNHAKELETQAHQAEEHVAALNTVREQHQDQIFVFQGLIQQMQGSTADLTTGIADNRALVNHLQECQRNVAEALETSLRVEVQREENCLHLKTELSHLTKMREDLQNEVSRLAEERLRLTSVSDRMIETQNATRNLILAGHAALNTTSPSFTPVPLPVTA